MQCLLGAKIVNPSKATLLGLPIRDISSVSDALTTKVNQLKRMGERLQLLSAHDAILLLKHSFSLPKLLYNLRTAPCFLFPVLQVYDELLKSTLSGITNSHFGEYDLAWSQATLPVRLGGLDIRSAVDLALSAYLALTGASLDLVHHVIPARLQGLPLTCVSDAFALWSQGHDRAPPEEGEQLSQRAWDDPRASALAESLLETAPNAKARVCLLASTAKESGAWLNILPISTIGLRMDDNSIRVAVGLRLGAPLCRPHSCIHCERKWTILPSTD